MPQVSVDDQYFLALDGEAGCDVHREECLAAARIIRGEQDNFRRVARHEFQIGAQHAECLVHDIAFSFLYDDLFLSGLLFAE